MPPSPALIFDLDGTLLDTAPDLLSATNAVLTARGRPLMDTSTLRHMVGFGGQRLIQQAMTATGAPVDEADMPALMTIFMEHYAAHICDFSRPFPGVAETLAALARDGARLAILTNKPHELTLPLLTKLDMAKGFVAVYGAGLKSYTKPNPQIFHDIVADCGGGPAVMIGDSITDLETARAASAPCILFSYGYTPVPAKDLGADAVLDDFSELPNCLRRLGFL